jgi:hypothetical protein
LPTFRDNLPIPSSKARQSKKKFLDCLALERKIYGLVKDNKLWRVWSNELETIIKGENIKCLRMRWLGHVERMRDTAVPKKMLYGKLYATRRRRRPRMRWLDDVSMDLREMGVSRWRDRARNREAWRHIVEEATARPGL